MPALRIIVDTNIFIGAAEDPHNAGARILRLTLAGHLQPLITRRIRRENAKIMRRLFRDQNPEAQQRLEAFFAAAEEVPQISNLRGITVDRDDDKFAEAAVDGDADYIITNDRDLLELERVGDTEIVQPTFFLQTFLALHPTLADI